MGLGSSHFIQAEVQPREGNRAKRVDGRRGYASTESFFLLFGNMLKIA